MMRFGAGLLTALDPSSQMSLLKRLKKSRQPSQQPASLGIPTHVAVGPLGFGAKLDPGTSPDGVLCSTKIQQPIALTGLDCRWKQQRGLSGRTLG